MIYHPEARSGIGGGGEAKGSKYTRRRGEADSNGPVTGAGMREDDLNPLNPECTRVMELSRKT